MLLLFALCLRVETGLKANLPQPRHTLLRPLRLLRVVLVVSAIHRLG